MAVLLNGNLVLLTPKAASTAIGVACWLAGGKRIPKVHSTLADLDPREVWTRTHAVVRNPLDILTSLFLMGEHGLHKFEVFGEFLRSFQHPGFLPGDSVLRQAEGVDCLYSYERLNEVEAALGIKLDRINETKNKLTAESYYTAEDLKYAQDRFAADIRLFNEVNSA